MENVINYANNVANNYEKISSICLKDNSYFNENERISIHDTIWHKVADLLWFINYEDKTNDNINFIEKLSNEISNILDNLINKINIILT